MAFVPECTLALTVFLHVLAKLESSFVIVSHMSWGPLILVLFYRNLFE